VSKLKLARLFSQAFKLNREAQEGFFCVVCSKKVKHQSSKGDFFFNVVCSRFEKISTLKLGRQDRNNENNQVLAKLQATRQ
jgi:hypothetical protein